jgi:hypothetical protein
MTPLTYRVTITPLTPLREGSVAAGIGMKIAYHRNFAEGVKIDAGL